MGEFDERLVSAAEKIAAALEAIAQGVRRKPLYSKSEVARILKVSRGSTLTELIEEGAIRTVSVGAREKIPGEEMDRLGSILRARVPPKRVPVPTKGPDSPGEAIRKIKLKRSS